MASSPVVLPLATGAVTGAGIGDLPTEISGLVCGGSGSIVLHDGVDASGPIIAAISGIGTVSFNVPVVAHVGMWAVVTGTAPGSVLL